MNNNEQIEDVFDPVLANVYLAALFVVGMFKPKEVFYLPLEKFAETSQLIGSDFETLKRFKVLYSKPLLVDPLAGTIYFEDGPSLDLNFKEQWIISKQGQRRRVEHIQEVLPNGQVATFIKIPD